METKRYRFYVGSNNDTKKPEVEKALKTLETEGIKGASVHTGSFGIWLGTKEDSFLIEVVNTPEMPFTDENAKTVKEALKRDLAQYDVLTTAELVTVI